jgi:hypothetical protein
MDNGLSLADAMAFKDNDGMNGWFWIIILFLFIFGANGTWGGYGNNNAAVQGALTRADLTEGFNFNQLEDQVRGLQQGQCQLGYNTLAQSKDTQASIAQLGYNTQSCCCETNRNIDSVKYENAQNTCAIITNQNEGIQRILDKMCQNEMQTLRDQLQLANFQISQQAQNAYLVNQLQPTPKPSYLTCSPYQSQLLALNAYGNGCCGC